MVSSSRSAWWVVVCRQWVVKVALLLEWKLMTVADFGTVISQCLMKTLTSRSLLGADGYVELERVVALIEQVKRDEVPSWKRSRSTSKKRDQ